MAVTVADLSNRAHNPVPVSMKVIRVLVVHECPLFRVGLRSLLEQQSDCRLVGEAVYLEDVLSLAREEQPDIVLLDGGLTSADPLDLVQQLRQVGVQGIMVFASETGDEEMLFHFLKYGAMAYVDSFLSGEELFAKMRRVAEGEYLITGDVLVAQAARRERLACIRQNAFLATHFNDAGLSSPQRVGRKEMKKTQESPCPISEQERATLEQIARGGTNARVAQALGISPDTVKNRLNHLFKKLNVHDRTAVVAMAMRNRWIVIDGETFPNRLQQTEEGRLMSSSQLTKRWRIEYQNGFVIECYRQRKPTRLADSWARAENPDGSLYGDYMITYHGLFNKQVTALARGVEWIATSAMSESPIGTKNP